jgi:hypothetical protein
MSVDEIEFNPGVVRPRVCLEEGWLLIKEHYWFFVALTFVAVFLGSMGPMGLLIGPMTCGLYICLLRHERGKPISFEMLFHGFNYFVPSLIATIFMMVPTVILIVFVYFALIGGTITLIVTQVPQGPEGRPAGPPGEEFFWALGGLSGATILVVFVAALLIKAIFLFAFPLIVDKQLSGFDAVRLSIRAVFANFGGIIGMLLLSELIGLLAFLICGVGVYLELPLSFAMYAVAYREVFPDADPLAAYKDAPQRVADERLPELPAPSAPVENTGMKVDPAS